MDTGLAFHFVSYLWLWFPPAPMARDRNDFFKGRNYHCLYFQLIIFPVVLSKMSWRSQPWQRGAAQTNIPIGIAIALTSSLCQVAIKMSPPSVSEIGCPIEQSLGHMSSRQYYHRGNYRISAILPCGQSHSRTYSLFSSQASGIYLNHRC